MRGMQKNMKNGKPLKNPKTNINLIIKKHERNFRNNFTNYENSKDKFNHSRLYYVGNHYSKKLIYNAAPDNLFAHF